MHHFILIFGFVLLPNAVALKCYECHIEGTCNETVKECPASQTRCSVMRMIAYVGGSKATDITTKSCTEPQVCVEGSFNFGYVRNVIMTECCSSDLCNTQSVPDPAKSTPNGRKCYTCSGQLCNQTLSCEDSEDHCISASVTLEGRQITMKGCASKLACANAIDQQIPGNIRADVSCCQGNYCNSAGSTSASLLLLVVPFIPVVIFS